MPNEKGAPKRILVVEDDEDMVEIYRELLGDDYSVSFVGTTDEARKALATGRVDLVLLDIILPKEMGNVLLGELLGDPRHADLKIVIVSVVKDFGTIPEIRRNSKKVAFLPKPFEREELVRTIERLLKG